MMLYIVRHGETDWNRLRRVQGHTDTALIFQRSSLDVGFHTLSRVRSTSSSPLQTNLRHTAVCHGTSLPLLLSLAVSLAPCEVELESPERTAFQISLQMTASSSSLIFQRFLSWRRLSHPIINPCLLLLSSG